MSGLGQQQSFNSLTLDRQLAARSGRSIHRLDQTAAVRLPLKRFNF
jgi:hypothetical protein